MSELSRKGAFYNEIEPYAAEWVERRAACRAAKADCGAGEDEGAAMSDERIHLLLRTTNEALADVARLTAERDALAREADGMRRALEKMVHARCSEYEHYACANFYCVTARAALKGGG